MVKIKNVKNTAKLNRKMKRVIKSVIVSIVASILVLSYSCKDVTTPSTNKQITSFIFKKSDNNFLSADVAGTIDEVSKTIIVHVPAGVAVTSIKPTIVHNGKSISPASGIAQNFDSAGEVVYTVTDMLNNSVTYVAIVGIVGTLTKTGKAILKTGDAAVFISKWTTTTADEAITLPLVENGEYDFSVNWGDGSSDHITQYQSANAKHKFLSPGTYEVRITGTFIGWRLNIYDLHLVEISQWGNFFMGDTKGGQFAGSRNIIITASDVPFLSNNKGKFTTDLHDAFSDATRLSNGLKNWDVSKVENMAGMFYSTDAFNEDLSSWNVSNATDMSEMFRNAKVFNQPIGKWNVSSVTNMNGMFRDTKVFNQPIGEWNVSKVTDMADMFSNALVFNQPIGNWNVSGVTNMNGMFQDAKAFNQPIGDWDVSNVANMSSMFLNALVFNQPIGKWRVSKVTDMSKMICSASAFNKDISIWDVSQVTNMSFMFYDTKSFNQPIGQWNVSKVTDMSYMFYDAKAFNQELRNWVVNSVQNMSFMFSLAIAFNQDISTWNVSQVTNMTDMFKSATVFNQNLSGWDVSKVSVCNNFSTSATLWTNSNYKPKFTNCTP